MSSAGVAGDWPGRDLGLPASGPRSIGRLGRRIGALAIDYGYTVIVSMVFFGYDRFSLIAIFAVTQIVSILLANGSIGHLLVGLRVVPVTGGRLQWWRPIVRTLLLCLVIPAVIWDKDQRGMHDRGAGTVLVSVR